MMSISKTALRRRTVLAATIALLSLSGAARALANPVDLQVVDRQTGQPLQVWRHHGRLFVAGQPGSNYALRVINNTNDRVLVVMSVDGVNILTGETAAYNQRGYVFAPHDSGDLTGWRKSLSEVAAFTFAPLPQSYAARTGRPGEVGVIGIAVFKEKVFVPPPPPAEPRFKPDWRGAPPPPTARARLASPVAIPVPAPDEPLPAPPPPPPPPRPADAAASVGAVVVTAEKRDDKLGTAHGALEASVTQEVPFERATSYPQYVAQVEYDTRDNLVAAGVIPSGSAHRPQPFPARPDNSRFVPDPPG
jgi:hypothetical protein